MPDRTSANTVARASRLVAACAVASSDSKRGGDLQSGGDHRVGGDDPVEEAGVDGFLGGERLGEADRPVERRRCESVPEDGQGREWHGEADGDFVGLELEAPRRADPVVARAQQERAHGHGVAGAGDDDRAGEAEQSFGQLEPGPEHALGFGPPARSTPRSNPPEKRPGRPARTTALTPSVSALSNAVPSSSSMVGERALALPSSIVIVASAS